MDKRFFPQPLGLKFRVPIGNFGRVLIHYASSQLVSNFLKMLAGFMVVRLVEPGSFGFFSGIGVFTGYILLGHGGIINGLGRELPYELGRGNEAYARELASSAYVVTFYISLIAGIIFLGFAGYYFFQNNYIHAITFLSYSIIGFITLFSKQFLPTLYRTNKDFKSLSNQNMLTGVGNLISVVFVWLYGFEGLCIRGVLLAAYEGYLLFKNKPYKLEWKLRVPDIKKLLGTGFPIFIAGQISPLLTTVTSNLIFSLGGAVSFGYYALCTIVNTAMGVIPQAFSQVVYPRMSIMYGEGKSIRHIIKVNIKPLFFQFGILLASGIVGAFLLTYLVPVLLPKYSPGIYAAQWMMFFPAAQAFGALLNIFSVIKKMKLYILSNIIGGLVTLIFAYVMVKTTGFRLEIFPQALIAGRLVQQGVSFFILKNIIDKEIQ